MRMGQDFQYLLFFKMDQFVLSNTKNGTRSIPDLAMISNNKYSKAGADRGFSRGAVSQKFFKILATFSRSTKLIFRALPEQ